MNLFETVIIAIVEGLTEFLPVSSTGHMILAQALLGVESSDFVKMFIVTIQFGAILSVIVLYWKRFFQMEKFVDFYTKLLIAFLPAAVLGYLLGDHIDRLLERVDVVAAMLVLGGIFMLFVDKIFHKPEENQEMDWKRALKIGFCQCVAMIPGVSRSMATIVGGMSQKLTRKNAAEFSFFLAVPTMAAASGYSVMKFMKNDGIQAFTENWSMLFIGNIVAFIVAMLAIKFFINFLAKYGFKAFGWYRIIVGGVILIMLMLDINLQII